MTNNVICGIFIILILLFLYKYKYKYNDIIKDIVNVETPNNNDKHYNDNIMNSLDKIKKYKKYNLNDPTSLMSNTSVAVPLGKIFLNNNSNPEIKIFSVGKFAKMTFLFFEKNSMW